MLQRAAEASWSPWPIVCDILGGLGSWGLGFVSWLLFLVSRRWYVVADAATRSEVDVETRVVGLLYSSQTNSQAYSNNQSITVNSTQNVSFVLNCGRLPICTFPLAVSDAIDNVMCSNARCDEPPVVTR
jgi:hypothetical protein